MERDLSLLKQSRSVPGNTGPFSLMVNGYLGLFVGEGIRATGA